MMAASFQKMGPTSLLPTMATLLVLLLLVPAGARADSFSLGAIRNLNHAPNGIRQYHRALTRWGYEVPASLTAMRGQIGNLQANNQSDDKEYLSPIGIGTPPQIINIDVDTGSADFWVYSSETETTGIGSRPVWRPALSSTAQRQANASWDIEYGDGSFALGNVWTDVVSLAASGSGGSNLSVSGATIESATDVSLEMVIDAALCGVAGLAFNLTAMTSPRAFPTLIDSLFPLLDASVFTADLRWHADGAYSFGSVAVPGASSSSSSSGSGGKPSNSSSSNATATTTISYTPLVPDAKYWQFNFTKFRVGGSAVWGVAGEGWSAIADTGTSLLLLDGEITSYYYQSVPGAAVNDSTGMYMFACDTQLPDFTLGFASGYAATIPGRYINYTAVEGMCMGGLQSAAGQPFSILGDIFLKAVYAVFDVGGKRIGFADKVLN